jgi:hypothetical protein
VSKAKGHRLELELQSLQKKTYFMERLFWQFKMAIDIENELAETKILFEPSSKLNPRHNLL